MLILGIITGLCYLVSTLWLIANLYNNKIVQNKPDKGLLGLIFLAMSLHAIIIYSAIVMPFGLNISFVNSLSLVAWLVVFLYLIVEIRKPAETLGFFVLPIACIAVILQLFQSDSVTLIARSFELQLHIVLSLLAYGLFIIAAGQAILLRIQTHYLKNKHPGGFIRSLPPLQSMEDLLFQIIQIGFILLTLALLSGFIFLDNIFAQHLLHKTVLSIIAWLLFAILLWGRWHFGWRGKKAINFTLGGFIFLMLSYFGTKIVLELIL